MKHRSFAFAAAVVFTAVFTMAEFLSAPPAKADDWQDTPCAGTPFRSADSAYTCRTIKGRGTSGPSGQGDYYILRGVKENVARFIYLCSSGMQTYCNTIPAEELKTAITSQRTADAAPKNWGEIKREKGSTYIPFESGTRGACLGFLHYDQAVDNGYRFRAIGHVCTDKNRSDKDSALETAAKEFTGFKR